MINALPHPISVQIGDEVILVRPGQEIPTSVAQAPVETTPVPLTQQTPTPVVTTTALPVEAVPAEAVQLPQGVNPVQGLTAEPVDAKPITAVASPAVQAQAASLMANPTPLLDSVPATAKLIAITPAEKAESLSSSGQPLGNGEQPLSNGDAAKAEAVKAESEFAITDDATPKSEADIVKPLDVATPATK